MFRLRDLKNGLYQIHKKNGRAFEGTIDKIFRKAQFMGVQPNDFRLAVEKLQVNEHDYADFHPNGKLICTQVDRRRVG